VRAATRAASRFTYLGPVRATLIFNAGAGGAGGVTSDELQAALVDAGYSPVYRTTSSAEDLDRVLEDHCDLVVVAGGDGTIRGVARRLAGRAIPLAVIPMGTANNIAGSLGITGNPVDVARRLGDGEMRPLDLGLVRAPWGEDSFLEAAGTGIFASVLAAYDPEAGKSPLRAMTSLVSTLAGYSPRPLELSLDGEDASGDYLLVEVMNTPAAGPRLRLAPGASPSDGLLDVVTVTEDGRVGLASYVSGLITGRLEELPNVTVRQVRNVRLSFDGSPFHLDAVLRPAKDTGIAEGMPAGGTIEVEVRPGVVPLLLPRQPEAEGAAALESASLEPGVVA
jgi:diacylglycerol kinase (ATP)